ncbi:MAG: Flp pilus assembly complex ATPase component TadA [Phycisphaerae bacterium]|nr:Flp pilus assembly complex ATPase component TadA [Phycisphaerae bacterium]
MSAESSSEFDYDLPGNNLVGIELDGSNIHDHLFNGKVRFGEWMVSNGYIKSSDLDNALLEKNSEGEQLGQVLQRLGILSEVEIVRLLSEYLSIEYVSLNDISKIDMKVARGIPESISRRFNVLGMGISEGRVLLAMADPLDIVALDTVAMKLKCDVKATICLSSELAKARESVYHGSYIEEEHIRNLVETETDKNAKLMELYGDNVIEGITGEEGGGAVDADEAPVIRFVNLLLSQAVKSGASDIHIEPQEKTMNIRMRIDGVLCDMVPPPKSMHSAVITRIKIISQMNIAERRLPQDGRFRIKAARRDIDVRVSVVPVIYGEKVVMRILDKAAVNHDIDAIGFGGDLLEKFKLILEQPHGIIIVTGPTGSGKSTTLYSALTYLRDPHKNITTVEDPVEYRLGEINQIQVKSEIELDFAACLRAILRQDPDIILIGEIRDKETVEIAIKASLTGHLVLSTFHTNDAPSALTRLAYMGVDRYLLASSINLVVAQRLIKRICEHCKEPVELDEGVLSRLGIDPKDAQEMRFYRGKGCNICNDTGYKGRLPIFEFLVMSPQIRQGVVDGFDESRIREISRKAGYDSLLACGARKVIEGVTTAEEVLRTTFSEEIA